MCSSAQNGVVHRQISGNPSEEVVLAVSQLVDVDPLEFGQRLNDVIDPDALDGLTDWSEGGQVGISFTFESCAVTIQGSELVVERRPSPE